MAAGLPMVVSDWSGYRDLVRDGVDGYLIPSAWASSASKVSVPLGWQQFTGIQGFPAIAGALAQLVHLDLAAAEMALLTLLSQPVMARAMGAAAARRARELFAPEVVMAAHEELFIELAKCRQNAPEDAQACKAGQPSTRSCAGVRGLCIPYLYRHSIRRCFNSVIARPGQAAALTLVENSGEFPT